jgi:hypothetical protein
MFYKTMGIGCDGDDGTCSVETECQGREATRAAVSAQARREGWAISSAGHFCPEHRQRAVR